MTHDNEEPSAASGGSGVCPYVTGTVTRYCTLTPFTLTDAEREALRHVVGDVADITGPVEDTIRGLLERTK